MLFNPVLNKKNWQIHLIQYQKQIRNTFSGDVKLQLNEKMFKATKGKLK